MFTRYRWRSPEVPEFGGMGHVAAFLREFRNSLGIWFDDHNRPGFLEGPVVVVKTYAASMAINWAEADEIQVVLAGNLDITAMSGGVSGKRYVLRLKQSGAGGDLLTVSASNVRYSTDIPSLTLSTGADLVDRIAFLYDGTDSTFDVVATNYGFG